MLSRHVESTSLVASSLLQGSANLVSKLKEKKTPGLFWSLGYCLN